LRWVAWSNLGGLGPNKTVTDNKGEVNDVPDTIMYWNVFNSSNSQDAVYLEVSLTEDSPPYSGDSSLNALSKESQWEFEKRIAERPHSEPYRIEGAYGAINVNSGTEVELQFTFKKYNNVTGKMELFEPEKVIAINFLDIDQDAEDPDGTETLGVCTGRNSWGKDENSNLKIPDVPEDEDYLKGTSKISPIVCHTVESTKDGFGDSNDNPWNPANPFVEDGKAMTGLERNQREKLFVAAYWGVSSFKASLAVKATDAKVPNRNFLFSGHATNFCEQNDACLVKKNYCDSTGLEDTKCLDRDLCEDEAEPPPSKTAKGKGKRKRGL